MSSQKPFKVVIIGAGIAGLSLAHALSLANIDYVILEKHHEPASNAGAVLFIWQHGARILDQFGLLDKFDAISKPLTEGYVRWAEDGTVFRKNTNFNVLADRYVLFSSVSIEASIEWFILSFFPMEFPLMRFLILQQIRTSYDHCGSSTSRP